MGQENSSTANISPPKALGGLKVLELGQLIAGPFAAKTLVAKLVNDWMIQKGLSKP